MFSYRLIPMLLWGALILTASCSSLKKSTTRVPVTMPEIEVSSNDPVNLYRASATKEWELVHTDIDIRFQIKERSATGTAQIALHPYYYATDTVVLDAKGMNILSVEGNGNQALSYRYDTLQLHIRLPKTYKQQDTLQLKIRYKALPYAFASGGSTAITDDKGLYFVNPDGKEPYQPVQIWTQGETSANSHWFPTFDYTNFRSTFRITMHVPDSFVTLSNGFLASSVKEQDGQRADTWKQDLPIPPYLVMMAAGNFAIAKEQWRGKEVSYYVPQEYAAYAKDIFRGTPEMMEYFSTKLGVPFPWNKYSQIVAYDYVSGAMENVSASLFGAFNLKDKRQLDEEKNDYIIVHELFHQWFGDYVTAKSWSNLTLNESFANYSEQLWNEHKYGDDVRAEGWRQDLAKYLNQSKWSDPPLVRFHYRSQEDMFDRVSYSKGGLILHYLRQLAGDNAFYDALHLYLSQHALQSAEATQLRLAFEQVTGKDWSWFFDQWYYRGGHPQLEVSYTYNDAAQNLTVTVLQQQPDSTGLYRLPMKAAIINGTAVREEFWDIEKKKEVFVYPYIHGERPVVVPDAAHWVPGKLTDKKSATQWLAQYQYAPGRLSKWLAVDAAGDVEKNDTAQRLLELALKDTDPVLRNAAIISKVYEGKKLPSAEWIRTIGQIAVHDPDPKTRASALNALGDMHNEEHISTYETAISDSSYRVAAAALYALDRVNHKRAVEYARELHPEKMKGNLLLYKAAAVMAKDGKKEDFSFFEQKTLQLFENNRMLFLNAVQDYIIHIDDMETFSKGVALLQKLAEKNPDAPGSFYAAAVIYNVQSFATKSVKVATDKALLEDWKRKKDIVSQAWIAYKAMVKSESIKLDIARMEKED